MHLINVRLTDQGWAFVRAQAQTVDAELAFQQSEFKLGGGWGFNNSFSQGGFIVFSELGNAPIPLPEAVAAIKRGITAGSGGIYCRPETGEGVPSRVKGLPKGLMALENFSGQVDYVPQADERLKRSFPIIPVEFRIAGRIGELVLTVDGQIYTVPKLGNVTIQTTAGAMAEALAKVIKPIRMNAELAEYANPTSLDPNTVINVKIANIIDVWITVKGWYSCRACGQPTQHVNGAGKCSTCAQM